MKCIRVFKENGQVIELFDNDNAPLEEFSAKLSEVFNSPNIVRMETTDGTLIVRPHKIDAILVNDVLDKMIESDNTEEDSIIEDAEEVVKQETDEDMITDDGE